MKTKNRKLLSWSMISFEMRNVMGNPFTHIFGIGMPTLMLVIISVAVTRQMSDSKMISMVCTSLFLAIGSLIPLATVLMGYSVSQAQELEKEIPQRMVLFGIKTKVTLVNRAVSELIFMLIAFFIYSVFSVLFLKLEKPTASGVLFYSLCELFLALICFVMAHAIANFFRRFGSTYCVTMLLYFAFMLFGGNMGIDYESMPDGMQAVARLLPVTYISRDFEAVWVGESYDFMPLVQSFLFLSALSGVMLFISLKRNKN